MKIKGTNIRIFYNGNVIAKARSAQIQINGNDEDTTTKDNASLATLETRVSASWQAQVESLDNTNITTLLTAWKNCTAITIKWDETGGTNNDTAQEATFARTGTAYISDATFTFNDREIVVSNVTFLGSGALSEVV